jgi:hypothetical protein
MTTSKLQAVALASLMLTVAPARAGAPKGWILAGSKPASYETGVDRATAHAGKASAVLRSRVASVDGFGTLMQTIKADRFLGKRVRLSGHVKADHVASWAGLWMRVDQAESKASLAFDNMQDRPIQGTTDWRRYEVVLDVPADASNIAFGILLEGIGAVWLDAVALEVVDKTVPTTGGGGDTRPADPQNLGFED